MIEDTNSNTTFVKVKLFAFLQYILLNLIQIQHLLKLNWSKDNWCWYGELIQIQHLLKLNQMSAED